MKLFGAAIHHSAAEAAAEIDTLIDDGSFEDWQDEVESRTPFTIERNLMAVVKRSAAAVKPRDDSPAPAVRRRARFALPDVELPTGPSEVSNDIRDFSIFVHGERKIGKTTLFSEEKGTLFVEFDPIQRALAIQQVFCPDWEHYLAFQDKLLQECKYKTIVIDRADIMYVQCQLAVCAQLGIDHPQDLGFGKGWDAVKKEFMRAVNTIMSIAPTRWIAHSTSKETEDRTGQKIDRLQPDFGKQADGVLTGLMDITAAYMYYGHERVLVIQGDDTLVAGHRLKGHFLTPRGRAVREIPMGTSSAEGYANFLKAFANEQTFTTLEERDKRKEGGKGKK